jgi:ABC-type branched-subunit amino acid transport system ATPase component
VLLEVNGLSKRFGGLQALHKVAFEMRAGEILGVIGPNGAGKSTLFNCVTGFVKPDEGSVRLAGHELVHLPPQHIARCGLSRSFQNGGLIASFSARDNVLLGQHLRLASPLAMLRPIGLGLEERSLLSEADALLGRAGLGARVGLPASALAYGEQRRLEIVRALAARPSVLMLDEPAAGMIEEEVNDLSILLRSLAGDGLSIVIVEHNVGFVANLCNRIVALDLGRVIASGPPAAVIRDRAVVAAYLGA